MQNLRQFWSSHREARRTIALQRAREQEAQKDRERLRPLLQKHRSEFFRTGKSFFSSTDLDLVVGYLCDGSLLGDQSHRALQGLCHLELSETSLQRIYDDTNVYQDDGMAHIFLTQKNLPRVIWMAEVRRRHLYDSYPDVFGRRSFLDDQTKELLELLDRFFRWDDHAGVLAFWDEVTRMPDAQREVFLTLLGGANTHLPSAEWEALISEFRQVSALV